MFYYENWGKEEQNNWLKGISRGNKGVPLQPNLTFPTITHTENPTTPSYLLGKIYCAAVFLTNQHEENKWRNKTQAFVRLRVLDFCRVVFWFVETWIEDFTNMVEKTIFTLPLHMYVI